MVILNPDPDGLVDSYLVLCSLLACMRLLYWGLLWTSVLLSVQIFGAVTVDCGLAGQLQHMLSLSCFHMLLCCVIVTVPHTVTFTARGIMQTFARR